MHRQPERAVFLPLPLVMDGGAYVGLGFNAIVRQPQTHPDARARILNAIIQVKRYATILMVLWTALVSSSLAWNVWLQEKAVVDIAKVEAEAFIIWMSLNPCSWRSPVLFVMRGRKFPSAVCAAVSSPPCRWPV